MLSDETYYQSKAAAMEAINEVNSMVDARTLSDLNAAESVATILKVILVCVSAFLNPNALAGIFSPKKSAGRLH